MTKLVEFIPNFSEGRRQEVIDQISEAAQGVPGAKLINVNVEPSYNRCVHTVVGDPEAVLEAGFRMCQKAVELIDMNHHKGEHPRIGAVDASLARRDLSCGSGKVIQISSTSPSAKKEAIISMRVRRKPTLRICRSVAVLAPRHMRAPLMSIPMKLRLGSRSASATVYSPLPQPSSSTMGLSLRKKSRFQFPFSGWSRWNTSSNSGCTKHSKKIATYSLRTLCEFKGKVLEDGFEGMLMDINNREVNVQFIGRFNASNLLAVYGAACLLGKQPEDVLLILSTLRPVAGRFDALRSKKGYTAIVDYAHTPDALVNVLNAIHEVLKGRGRVITVVGAGGNRDKGKRPIMAQEAAKQSDRVIITSDNPRFEEPQDIINDMLAGLTKEDMNKVLSIADRKEAIRTACMLAQAGDVILVAGKGHENYQEIKGVKHHFDDKEVLAEIFDNE